MIRNNTAALRCAPEKTEEMTMKHHDNRSNTTDLDTMSALQIVTVMNRDIKRTPSGWMVFFLGQGSRMQSSLLISLPA